MRPTYDIHLSGTLDGATYPPQELPAYMVRSAVSRFPPEFGDNRWLWQGLIPEELSAKGFILKPGGFLQKKTYEQGGC